MMRPFAAKGITMARVHKQSSPPRIVPAPQPAKPATLTRATSPGLGDDGDGRPDVFIPSAPAPVLAPQKPAGTVNAAGTVRFGSGYSNAVQGDLVAGGKLNVDYDMGRFSKLLTNSHDGYPA